MKSKKDSLMKLNSIRYVELLRELGEGIGCGRAGHLLITVFFNSLSGVYTRVNDMIGEARVKRLSSAWRPQLSTLI